MTKGLILILLGQILEYWVLTDYLILLFSIIVVIFKIIDGVDILLKKDIINPRYMPI